MKRICIITEEGRGGGALKRIQLISASIKNDVDITVLLPTSAKRLKNELNSNGIKIYSINFHPLSKDIVALIKYCFFFIPELIWLCIYLLKKKPDIVHCNGSWQIKGILASFICKTVSIWHMNDSYQPYPVKMLFKILSPLCQHYIFASSRTSDYYSAISQHILTKTHWIVPAPVDTETYFPKDSPGLFSKDSFNILSVGFINRNKGLEYLIETAGILHKTINKPIQFYIAGPVLDSQQTYFNTLRQRMNNLNLENISFLGYKQNIPDLLASCDLYFCTSIQESSPMAVWEALASGCLVISTDVGDVKEIFDNYGCGLVVECHNPIQMAEEIERIYVGLEDSQRMKKTARQVAVDLFSVKHISNKYLEIYQTLG